MLKFNYMHARHTTGFTLIELMITVAIVAILSTIAYPSYVKSVLKSHRTDAKSALLDIAGREERLYSTTGAYSSNPADVGYSGASPFSVGSGYYTVSITLPAVQPAFNITANATATGGQTGDLCQTFTVTQTGAETASASSCWLQ